MKGKESFCLWRDGDDYNVDWSWTPEKLKRFVDAVGEPYDGAKIKNRDIIIRDVEILDGEVEDFKRHQGKIFRIENGKPVVVCGNGLVKLTIDTKEDIKKIKTRL